MAETPLHTVAVVLLLFLVITLVAVLATIAIINAETLYRNIGDMRGYHAFVAMTIILTIFAISIILTIFLHLLIMRKT